jgi:hypothetical protein
MADARRMVEIYDPDDCPILEKIAPVMAYFDASLIPDVDMYDRREALQEMLRQYSILHIDLIFTIMDEARLDIIQSSETERRSGMVGLHRGGARVNILTLMRARHVQDVLSHLTDQDTKIWFIISPFLHTITHEVLNRPSDYDDFAELRNEKIRAVLGLRQDQPLGDAGRLFAQMWTLLHTVDQTMKDIIRNTHTDDRRELIYHSEQLKQALWLIFRAHRDPAYRGSRSEKQAYDRIIRRTGLLAFVSAVIHPPATGRVGSTGLRYDLDVKDADAPVDEEPCVVCLDRRRIVTAVPCTHKVTCGICSAFVVERMQPDDMTGLHPCPMCRTPVQYFEIRSEPNQ